MSKATCFLSKRALEHRENIGVLEHAGKAFIPSLYQIAFLFSVFIRVSLCSVVKVYRGELL
jgi:hypothetical protein